MQGLGVGVAESSAPDSVSLGLSQPLSLLSLLG